MEGSEKQGGMPIRGIGIGQALIPLGRLSSPYNLEDEKVRANSGSKIWTNHFADPEYFQGKNPTCNPRSNA